MEDQLLQFATMIAAFVRFVCLSLSCGTIWGILSASPVAAESDAPVNRSYIGVGAAIGILDNTTSLGTGGFPILTKVGFSEHLSLHDATILFGNGAPTSMIILTAELPIRNSAGKTIISPFLGGGALLRYQNGISFSPAISGGVDVPLSPDLTGTLRLNAGFPQDRRADLGVLIGVGYNLGG